MYRSSPAFIPPPSWPKASSILEEQQQDMVTTHSDSKSSRWSWYLRNRLGGGGGIYQSERLARVNRLRNLRNRKMKVRRNTLNAIFTRRDMLGSLEWTFAVKEMDFAREEKSCCVLGAQLALFYVLGNDKWDRCGFGSDIAYHFWRLKRPRGRGYCARTFPGAGLWVETKPPVLKGCKYTVR